MKRIHHRKPSKNPCGYCHNRTHRGFVTVDAMKDHKCMEKACPFLQIFDEHPYIQKKERQNLENRVRKHMIKTNPGHSKSQCYEKAHSMSHDELKEYLAQHVSENMNTTR